MDNKLTVEEAVLPIAILIIILFFIGIIFPLCIVCPPIGIPIAISFYNSLRKPTVGS